MCTIRSGHDFSPLHLVLQDELCEGLGSRVSQAGRHLHPLLDRSAPAWPPPVVGQGAHPDGKPWQSYIICFISNSGQHKNGLNTLQVRSDQSCNKKSSCFLLLLSDPGFLLRNKSQARIYDRVSLVRIRISGDGCAGYS